VGAGLTKNLNLLVGRDIKERMDKNRNVILTMPLLCWNNGVEKMSKSL